MTRAEHSVYVTGTIPKQNREEQKNLSAEECGGYGMQYITKRFEQYKNKPEVESISFLRFLPVLSDNNPLYTITAIDLSVYNVQKEKEKSPSLEEAAPQVLRDYETIQLVPPYHFVPQTVNASSLHFQSATYYPSIPGTDDAATDSEALVYSTEPQGGECSPLVYSTDPQGGEGSPLDKLLTQSGIGAPEFGTIVHGFIEAIFNGTEPKLPSGIAVSLGSKNQQALVSAAQSLAEGFFNSELGHKAHSAAFRKTEYPILTAVEGRGRRILVSGTIDLLFGDGPSLYVVDFKTDRDEDITRHIGQLAIYKRAAEDIFGKPAECRLFYLRSSREADLNEEISKTSPEELIAEL
jgi:ATP-dependent exoDNAse (exonuclease V) beta subunit